MRRIVRAEAICLRVQDYHESSKLVTFFTLEHGKVSCLAKGARRLRSKFGAALDLFAQSRIIYYSHETRTLLTLSDAELVRSFSSLATEPERFLAAEQMSEFVLRVIQPQDPSPQLYQLLLNYLATLESVLLPSDICHLTSDFGRSSLPPPPPSASPQSPDSAILHSAVCSLTSPYPALVCSFLLKAASFLGFRPELRRCLFCRRPIESRRPAYFDPGRGGIICPRCAGERGDMTGAGHDRNRPGISDRVPSLKERSEGLSPVFPALTRLDSASLDTLSFLLYTPAAEIAQVCSTIPRPASEVNRQERQDAKGQGEMAKCEQGHQDRQGPAPDNLQSAICNLQFPLDLVLGFLGHHFDPLVLNSFRWHAGLERNI